MKKINIIFSSLTFAASLLISSLAQAENIKIGVSFRMLSDVGYKHGMLIEDTVKQIIELLGCEHSDIVNISAKNGIGIKNIFNSKDKVITRLVKFTKVTRLLLKESGGEEKSIILSSLWMSHIIAFILKILLKNITWFSFLHTSNYHNIINYLVCTKLTRLADKQIFDSYSTAKAYNNKKNNRQEIVNFFLQIIN